MYSRHRITPAYETEGSSRSISRVLSEGLPFILRQRHHYLPATYPGAARTTPSLPYSVLLRVGFTMPSRVTTDAVRSYRTLSPLPATVALAYRRLLRRSTLCCTFRRLAPPRNYLAPCPVEPGLSSPQQMYSEELTHYVAVT